MSGIDTVEMRKLVDRLRVPGSGALWGPPITVVAADAIEALLDAAEERDALAWFSEQHRLSLSFYSPIYGDDDDQSLEWRVYRERGPINDREWETIGSGQTAIAAVIAARAALSTPTKEQSA